MNENRATWLVPALIGALVAILGTSVTFYLTSWKDVREHTRGVANIRAEIIEAAIKENPNLPAVSLSLNYVLEPVDETGTFSEFSEKIIDLISDRATETSQGTNRDSLSEISPVIAGDVAELIGKFGGSDRLSASNALIERAKFEPNVVVDALVSNVKPDNEEKSYRTNLYTVFTLARITNGWPGTAIQLQIIESLRESLNYKDATFKSRTEEAIANWRART